MSPASGAPPGEKRDGRPLPRNGHPRNPLITTTSSKSLQGGPVDERLIRAAAALVNSIADQARRDEETYWRAWKDASRVFFDRGVEVGRQQLGNEIFAEEEKFGRHMSTIRRLPIYAELEARRWGGRREDFGNPRPGDFKGFGATYEPPTTGAHVRDERGAA